MFDRKRNLNKLIKARKLAEAKQARRMKASKTKIQKVDRSATQTVAATNPVTVSRPKRATQSHLTDTEALTRKVREEMVKGSQAAFAAVMAELNASQTNTAASKPKDSASDVP